LRYNREFFASRVNPMRWRFPETARLHDQGIRPISQAHRLSDQKNTRQTCAAPSSGSTDEAAASAAD